MERRKPLKRTGIKRKSADPKRKPRPTEDEWVQNRPLAIQRDKGKCQMPFRTPPQDVGECGSGIVVHHIQPGGMGKRRNHALANLVVLCPHHHDWVHAHPEEAKALGLLLSIHDEPLTDP